MEGSNEKFESDYFKIIMEQINQFRLEPNSYLGKLTFTKTTRKLKDYEEFVKSLESLPKLIFDETLFSLAKEEMEKFVNSENYNNYQIGEEFQSNLKKDYDQKEVALIALETLDNIEEIIQRIIINDSDDKKKGRKILTNKEYTHIGFFKSEENSIIFIFAKKETNIKTNEDSKQEIKDNKDSEQTKGIEETKEKDSKGETEFELNEEEKIIIKQINDFRENPKSFIDKKGNIKAKKKKTEYETFIKSLEKMNELKLDKELFDIAKQEVKLLINDGEYNKIQIGSDFKGGVSNKFIKDKVALLAIEEIDNIENIIQKIIINDSDQEKKGRLILTSSEYTHIGFCQSEESSIIFIFAKNEIKEENDNKESNKEDNKESKEGNEETEKKVELTDEENKIMNIIKEFRENPKSFIDKKGNIKAKKKKEDYENFIKSLEKMNELKIDKELCKIAKEEVKLLIEGGEYNKIQTDENIRKELKERLPNKELALLVVEEIDKIEDIIQKIIINEADQEKKGRIILTDISFTHIGLSQFIPTEEGDDDKPIIFLFSKDKDIKKIKDNDKKLEENNKDDKQTPGELENNNKIINNIDNNVTDLKKSERKEQTQSYNNFKDEPKDKSKISKNINLSEESKIAEEINKIKKDNEKEKNNNEMLNIYKNNPRKNNNQKDNNSLNKVDEKLLFNKNKIFFFTSLNLYNYSSIKLINSVNFIDIDEDNFECKEETMNYFSKKYIIFNFRLNTKNLPSFFIYIYFSNNRYYFRSNEIKIEEGVHFLGHITLYYYTKIADQMYFTNVDILYRNIFLIKLYKAEQIYMKFALKSYKPDKNLDLKYLLSIMKLFADNEYPPLFLKDININNVKSQNYNNIDFNLEDNSIFIKLGNLIVNVQAKDNAKIENKKNCYLFLLDLYSWVYYKYNQRKFKELINTEDLLFRASLSRLISNKIIKIKDIQNKFNISQEKIIPLIIESSSSFDELKNIFLNYNNIIEALNSVYSYIDKLIKKLENNTVTAFQTFINFFTSSKNEISLPDPTERDDIKSILNLQKNILNKMKPYNLKNDIINFENILAKLIEVNEKAKNIKNLIDLKELVKNLKENGKNVEKINENLSIAIHDSGISLALTGKLKNNQIIKFIKKDEFYILEKYEQSSKRDPNVFKYFDLLDKNKEGFQDFINLKLYNKFHSKKIKFYNIFIDKLQSFDDLSNLFELFQKEKLDEDFIYLLLKKMKNFYLYIYYDKNLKKDDVTRLNENIYIIFLNMMKYKYKVKDITKIIEEKFEIKSVKDIYIQLLSKNNNELTEYIKEEFSNYFIYNLQYLNAEGIYFLIKSCSNNKKFLKTIFNNINDFVINENDFFSPNKSPNFELYELFIKNGYVNDIEYLATSYFEKIGILISKIFSDIKDLKISFLKVSDLIDKNKDLFLSKIKLIFMNEQSNPDELFYEIIKSLDICKSKISQLNKIHDYLILFEPQDNKNLIDKLQIIINRLRNKQINEILNENEIQKIPDYNSLIRKSDNLKFKESIFFLKFYDELKKEKGFNFKENDLFNEALNLYNNIIKKIINYKNENFMSIEKIIDILDVVKNKKNEIEKEMLFISVEFKEYIFNCNVTIESIKNNLYNFSNLKEIQDYCKGYIFILSLFQEISKKKIYKKTEFTTKLELLTKELSLENVKSETVEESYKILNEYGININNKGEDDFGEFILKIIGKANEIKFCVNKSDEEIKNLNEFLQDRQSESGNLQPDDFNDFIGCKKYVNEVIHSDFSNDKQLNDILRSNFKKDKSLILKFNNYLEKYGEIKELYEDSIANKSEITKTFIQKLMKNSILKINKLGNNFIFIGQYGEKKEKFDLKLLLQLKNKALFAQNTVKEDEIYKEQITKFNNIVLKIYNLSETIKNLILSGYPPDISINLKINDNSLYNVDNENMTVKEIIKKYENLLDKFNQEIIKSYKSKPYLRFLYGPLFMSIYEKIKNNNPIEFLLKSISNGKIKILPKKGDFHITDDADFSEIFSVINRYLDDCFLINNINMERILKKNQLLKKKQGLYRVAVFSEFERNLLLLYLQLTGNLPLTNTVLICNEYTSNEEIKAFLYLSFMSDYPTLFCLLGIEKLDSEKRVKTIKSINQFNKKYGEKTRGCLVIMYLKNSEIEKPLTKIIPDRKEIILNEENEDLKFDFNNIEIYTSIRAGFGKTEEIKNKVNKENKHYKYFPLGGEFTREEVIQRLIDFNLPQNDNGNYAIHFDLSETNLTELVQEILFKILILKKLDVNEKVFYFGDELKIKIELPNGFYNYLDKFPILKLFKSNIDLKQLLPLRMPLNKEKAQDIQIVANTLNMFKQHKIGYKNINLKNNAKLSFKQCQDLIDEYLKNNENDYNYYQKINYINLLAVQFKMFKECIILGLDGIDNDMQKNAIIKSREQIIKCILETTLFFTKGPYDDLIKSQMTSQESDEIFDEEKSNKRAIESLKKTKDKISFDSIPETLFFFNADLSTFTAITKSKKGSDEYNLFYNLINIQSIFGGKKMDLPNYLTGDHFFYLNELKKILGLPEVLFDENEILELNKAIKEETKEELDSNIFNNNINEDRKLYMAKLAKKNGNYIYTRDNFIKSVIILLKIQASIPVILMGETGCGKTSLLKMLSIFMNKGFEKMKTLNIHAGTNEEDIISFMREIINNIDKEKEEELKKIMDRFDNQEEKYRMAYNRNKILNAQKNKLDEKKIWVFFDELNTCNSMGLLTEIMCKRTMQGEPLPNNLVFLGAVNPYRTMTSKMKNSGLTYHTDIGDKTRNLVYTVNPLPHTLMNYIFNFGNLEKAEEKEYIKSMILENFTSFYKDKEDKEYKKILYKTLGSICDCHNFLRQNYDESSVSLREIRRFNIFFKFFIDYLGNKSNYKQHYANKYNLLLGTLNITLYLCYYLRISDKKIREDLTKILDPYFQETNKLFIEMPMREVTYISEQFIIDYEKGIALNRSLKENLFTSFICIVNRIPLIIVGKPGEGKSLTIQTINQTMKGIYSKSPLFKEYPQLFMYNYQGSETSTSQGIIETFDKARAYARNQLKRKYKEDGENKEKFIAMIFFDEMGLAERSPNNPLKAIHSQLEYDDNEFKIAFVGISNWKIDASKMNRCLTLSKPDPDKEDLILTADIIAKALDNTIANNYKTLIESLAIAYYEYKKTTNTNKLIENFHGNRDFYHLIKCAMRELIKQKDKINDLDKEKILTKIGIMSLTRNFGGLETSLIDIKNIFKKVYVNYNEDELYNYNILECIKDNLNDYNSRFLMLVANSTIIKYLENVLEEQGKDYIFLTGSQFQQDKKAAEKGGGYSEDLLNKIQYQMSKESVLILKNLEVIYPSLYELFNQNYLKIGDKYFSKIAFASSKSSSEVNKNFRVILLITQQQLEKMKVDPPLLNRFEKQIVSFKDSLNEKQINLASDLITSFENIRTFNKEKNLVYNLPDLMINCNIDEIEGLIYKISNKYKDKKDDNDFIENEIFKIIVPTFCQDIIASIKYSGFAEGNNAERAKKILDIYKQREINNFSQFLNKMKKDKNVIYTFSNIYDIFIPEEKDIKYKEIIVENIYSENKVQEELSKFYEEDKQYLIFRFVEKDLDKMNHLSYLVNNFETKYKQKNDEEALNNSNDDKKINNLNLVRKKIIFLIHLTRKNLENNKSYGRNKKNKKNKSSYFTEELISNLDESYDKYFIDNLRSERNDFINILDIKSPTELITSIIDFDIFLDKNLNKIISYFDYNFVNKFDEITLKDYTDRILNKLILEKDNKNVKFLRKN